MAEAELQVLIKAVDEMSGTLKRIENNTSKATTSLQNSFRSTQGAMLNLGQAALGVKNIFDIQENATRNLENATDRLENAKLRLKQATNDLEQAEKDLTDIQENQGKATLQLERAQLNLEDAQKAATFAINFYGKESRQAKEATIALKEAQFDLRDSQRAVRKESEDLAQAQQNIIDKQDAVQISTNNMERSQRALQKVINDNRFAFLNMGVQALAVAGNFASFLAAVPALIAGLSSIAVSVGAVTIAGAPLWAIILAITAAVVGIILVWKNWETMNERLKLALTILFAPIIGIIALLKNLDGVVSTLKSAWESFIEVLNKAWDIMKKVGSFVMSPFQPTAKRGSKQSGGPIAATGMYMLHQGEYVVPKRDAGGITININGDLYGLNERKISEELYNRLRYTLTT